MTARSGKLLINARIITREEREGLDGKWSYAWRTAELTEEELTDRLRESKEELFNLRFQMATLCWTTTVGCAPCAGKSHALHGAAGT